MDENEVRRLLAILEPYIHKIVQKELTNTGVVHHIPAKVLSADNEANYANVRILAADYTAEQDMTIANRTGRALKSGDPVWVEYAYSLDNAFVALVNTPNPWE